MGEPNSHRTRKQNATVWEALAWLGFAAFAYYMTLPFDEPLRIFKLGAAFWPHVVIIGMVIAALVLLTSRFVRGHRARADDDGSDYFDKIADPADKISGITLVVFALPLIWIYGMHKMGFLVVTPFFLIAFTWLMGVRRWLPLLSFSLGFYAVLVLVFYKLIFTPLPMGAGWFHSLNGEFLGLIQ